MENKGVVGPFLAVLRRWLTKSATNEKDVPKRRHQRGCWLCGASGTTKFSTEYGWYQVERMTSGAFARTSYLRVDETNVLLCAGCLETAFGSRPRDAAVQAYAWLLAKKDLAAQWKLPVPHYPFNAFYPTAEEFYYGQRKTPQGRISEKNQTADAAYFAKNGIYFHGYAGAQHHGLREIKLEYWLAPKLKDVDSWEWAPIRRPGY